MSCNRSSQSGYFYYLYLFNITASEPELLWTICILFLFLLLKRPVGMTVLETCRG